MIWRSNTPGKLMVAVFLLWQVVAVLHLVVAVHSLCPEHHAVAHAGSKSGNLQHKHQTPLSSDDGCFVLVALAANGGMPALDSPLASLPVEYLLDALHPAAVSVVLQQRYRFRLAPSQSPPFSLV